MLHSKIIPNTVGSFRRNVYGAPRVSRRSLGEGGNSSSPLGGAELDGAERSETLHVVFPQQTRCRIRQRIEVRGIRALAKWVTPQSIIHATTIPTPPHHVQQNYRVTIFEQNPRSMEDEQSANTSLRVCFVPFADLSRNVPEQTREFRAPPVYFTGWKSLCPVCQRRKAN